jgi:hypothetical protein
MQTRLNVRRSLPAGFNTYRVKVSAAVEPEVPLRNQPICPQVSRLIRVGAGGNGIFMPLLRYFMLVGGGLLALLFVANAAFPIEPLPQTLTSGSDLPPVRIHTERKLPERVEFDTSAILPGQAHAAPVVVAQAKPQPKVQTQAQTQAQALPPSMAEMSAKARVREAFAQLPQQDDASQPTMSDMATVVVPEPKMYPAHQPVKRKVVAKPRTTHPMMMVAQQPRFGGFDTW